MNDPDAADTAQTQAALARLLAQYRERVERALECWLPALDAEPAQLHEAMRYAVLSGGKRLRAVLVYAAGVACRTSLARLDAPACAVELLHAYSLVHDDLPAMDDDDLRRGKPSCHKAFGEATAILAGDALQTLAFYALSDGSVPGLDAQRRLEMVRTLALASGSLGMAGGQAIDLAAEGRTLDLSQLEGMHSRKTGALIRASVHLGALGASGAGPESLDALDRYASCVGLAFQIQDDILDVVGDTETLGKPQGSDVARGKSTYPALVGLERAREMAQALHAEALEALGGMGAEADPLRWLSSFVVARAS